MMRALLAGLALSACSTVRPLPSSPVQAKPPRVTRHTFAPTHVIARPIPRVPSAVLAPDPLAGLSPMALYVRGEALLEARKWGAALKVWNRLLAEYPDAVQRRYALLGSGAALQALHRCPEALPRFEEFLDLTDPDEEPEDVVDGRFREGICFAETKQYRDVVIVFSGLLEEFTLPTETMIAAHASQGVGHFMLGDRDEAQRSFKAGIDLYNVRKKIELLEVAYYVGQSYFYFGELARERFTKVDLAEGKTPESMAQLLDVKCDHLLAAQKEYLSAIHSKHFGWSSAAAHQVGRMYESLFHHMHSVPAPDELSQVQKVLYRQELSQKVRVLLKKAIRTWSAAVDFAGRTGTENTWVVQTRERLTRIQQLYYNEYLDPARHKALEQALAAEEIQHNSGEPVVDPPPKPGAKKRLEAP
jgi:tetratricopeptide (TPR) repeat protein